MKLKLITFISISLLLFHSCVTYDNAIKNPYHLTKENLSCINGIYEETPTNIRHSDYKSKTNRFFEELDRKLIKDTINYDSTLQYQFEIKVISENMISISYIQNGKIFKERNIKTKLKNDGYLYLKNKNYGLILVPYIFGILDINKMRLTKSNEGKLILDVKNFRSGAAALVIYLHWFDEEYRCEYKEDK